MAVDWNKISIIDGWEIVRDGRGYTLSAQFHAPSRDVLPDKGDKLPSSGKNAPPGRFVAYRVTEVQSVPLTGAGPYIAQVTAGGGLTPGHFGGAPDSVLSQTELQAGYMDYHIHPGYAALRAGEDDTHKGMVFDGWHSGKWLSALDARPGDWVNWAKAIANENGVKGSPFRRLAHPSLADRTMRFLVVTATFHRKEDKHGLEKWGGFSGIVPVRSFPDWVAIPGGDNRWRLYDEEIDRVMETDGKTVLFRVRRTLLGIPPAAKDVYGNRMQWEQQSIGQRDWGDL